jgi:hypothetical protein
MVRISKPEKSERQTADYAALIRLRSEQENAAAATLLMPKSTFPVQAEWTTSWKFTANPPYKSCRRLWADASAAVGSEFPGGPGFCRFDRRIVQRLCMPKERFPPRVFSAEIFSQLDVI